MEQFNVKTSARTQMIDITDSVMKIVQESNVKDGLVTIFIPHTTAAITINENADPDVQRDVIYEIDKIIPFNDGYRHQEGNSAAHIKASLFGSSETVIISDGRMQLGTWQGIYFCEFDGSRNRKVWVHVSQ